MLIAADLSRVWLVYPAGAVIVLVILISAGVVKTENDPRGGLGWLGVLMLVWPLVAVWMIWHAITVARWNQRHRDGSM